MLLKADRQCPLQAELHKQDALSMDYALLTMRNSLMYLQATQCP